MPPYTDFYIERHRYIDTDTHTHIFYFIFTFVRRLKELHERVEFGGDDSPVL